MADIHDVLTELKELRKENREDHKTMFGQLSDHNSRVSVLEDGLKTHKDLCEKKHGWINRILWMFGSVIILSAGALVLKELING